MPTNRLNRGVILPSISPKGVAIPASPLIARITLPSRFPAPNTKPSMTRPLPSASVNSSGPDGLLTMKTTLGDRLRAKTGKRSRT